MVHQLVIGRAEQRVAGKLAQPRAVDQRLRVLDAKAYRERLGLHEHLALVKHAKCLAGAVAQRQHDMVGAQAFAAGQGHAAHLPRLDEHVGHLLTKPNLTPSASISSRMRVTTPVRRKVPMCGLLT